MGRHDMDLEFYMIFAIWAADLRDTYPIYLHRIRNRIRPTPIPFYGMQSLKLEAPFLSYPRHLHTLPRYSDFPERNASVHIAFPIRITCVF